MLEVILISGGIESTTLLYLQHPTNQVIPVFVDYGQRAARQELASANAHVRALKSELVVLDISKAGAAFRTRQNRKLHVPMAHRNLVLLSLGLSFAAQAKAQRLSLALNWEDTQSYPSATAEFIHRFQTLARLLENLEIATPLIEMSKDKIILTGKNLNIDFTQTYSCLLGYARHCGACPQCLKRRAAMRQAGLTEPPGFYRGS